MKPLTIDFPSESGPAFKTYEIDLIKFKPNYEKGLQIKEEQQKGVKYAYSIYMQHCTDGMKLKLKSMQECEDVEENQDGIGLVKLLWLVCLHQEGQQVEANDARACAGMDRPVPTVAGQADPRGAPARAPQLHRSAGGTRMHAGAGAGCPRNCVR